MVISLGPLRDRPRRRLRGGSRLSASASNLIAAGSEIAAGRIALFTPAGVATGGHLSLLLSSTVTVNANLDCQRVLHVSPAFTGHPCSVQLGLSSRPKASDHPFSLQARQLSKCEPAMTASRSVVISLAKPPTEMVPKGRFELPRGYPHYALNVARLPVPPLRLATTIPNGADLRTRTPDLLFTKQLLYRLS